MVYNTGYGASRQKLPDKSQISGKRSWILWLEIEKKKKVKHEILFRNYSSRLARALSTIRTWQAELEQSRERKCLWGNYQELASQTYLEILVPYLNNSSEETIFGSNKIKEQLETMKLQNEFHLKPWLLMNWNRPAVSA